ncbi:Uncharacterised protein [Acholeplasma oculi]|nr:hypothetical protein [Acholeplasma oculi]SKC34968.1 hypothetical protein SAMN02745122_0137 [Acholeplasma oculi]SUT89734.1 Uncharacterised protein [Acholeplasma oculi]
MKKLNIKWEGVTDTTGYLFSFAKSLSAAVKNSPFSELSEDIVASSGFAFRMWVAADLCPSAMSIWAFNQQKPWVENGGFSCEYIERMWGHDDIEEERRVTALEMIKHSINNGIAAISWDIGVPEWGLITGYDDEMQKLYTLSITGAAGEMDYTQLGKREIPILNVLTITGKTNKPKETIVSDSLKLAKNHLNGEEWCDNEKGLAAYAALAKHFENVFNPDSSWNIEYYLGTYSALKWYAWRFFEKYGLTELAELYKMVYDCWQKAFEIKKSTDISSIDNRQAILKLLKKAENCEREAVKLM